MLPFKYLEISNHKSISEKLKNFILNDLYLNLNKIGNIEFSFIKTRENQKRYDIHKHINFWNFLSFNNVIELVPELITSLNKIDVFPTNFNLVVINKGYGVLHTDGGSKTNKHRINWPIYNCDENSRTYFYKLKNLNETVDDGYFVPISEKNSDFFYKTKIYGTSNIEHELGYYVLTQPVLFDYTIPHELVHINDEEVKYPRIILSIDFLSTCTNG